MKFYADIGSAMGYDRSGKINFLMGDGNAKGGEQQENLVTTK